MSETKNGSLLGGIVSGIIIIVAIMLVVGWLFGGKEDKNTELSVDEINGFLSKQYPEESEQFKIAKLASERIKTEYEKTDINNITVNENLGTEESDDYILLIDLTWNRMNGVDMTKDMIRMYCDDLSAYTVKENSKIQEITLFWTIPYHQEEGVSAKCSYEQRNGGMYLTDKMGLVGEQY